MMKLLREPHLSTWKDFEVINHNACYPGIDFKLALTQNQQVDVLTALNPLMRHEGELSVKNLCSQLISSGLINDQAIASYQKSCGHVDRRFPAIMNFLALARIEKAGAFDALRALREGDYPLPR